MKNAIHSIIIRINQKEDRINYLKDRTFERIQSSEKNNKNQKNKKERKKSM